MAVAGGQRQQHLEARRRYYQLTPLGAQAVREEAELLARLVDAAHIAGLLDGERRTT